MLIRIKRLCTLSLLESGSNIFHEFIIEEINANCWLQFVQIKLFEENICTVFLWNLCFFWQWQCFNRFDHQISWEITTNKTDHLMVVKASDCMIVGCTMKHFSYLLQKAFSIELSGTNESIFSKQNVLTLKSRIKT